MASNGRFEYTIGFKTDDSGLKQARKALQDIQNLTVDSPGVTGMSENLENAKHAAAELETALTKAYNVKMGTTSVAKLDQELKNLNRPLSEIYEDMKSIGPVGETAFNKIAAQAMKTNLQIKQGNTILNKFGKTLWRNVEWLISGNLINTVTGVFTKAYGYTKNLDESLNNIRIVTGKGADEMARFGKEAQETAAKLGKGTTDITNASLIFYQQGLDKAEVDARTEVATKLANVSQQSAETTADQLTAVWNGFQAGTDDLEHYADVMTAIAASTASSSSELAGAISKVSSIAHTTGVDMEQLSAMISTVISVTRDSPETVGTAFKTIFARMDDLVEDGTDEFGVSLGRVSSHLKAMGIEILNEDGSLRDLGDTLTETGDKWKSYSREQQLAIAEQIGGKRQWNQVLALFDNWDKYRDALDVAKDSTGALQKQQDIYMESTRAHLQAVKTAWEGVYGEMMTADNINIVADAITKVLEVVQGFIQGVGGMGPIINALGATLLKAFSDQIAQNVLRISTNIKGMFYNIDEQKAQQSLMTQFGVLDSKLLQDMTKDHAKILNYQKDITKEQQDYYNKLVDSRVAADEEYRVLEDKKKKLDEILATNKDINAVVQSKKGAVTTEGIGDLAIAKQAAAQQIVDTGIVETSTGRDVSLEMTEVDERQTQGMIKMTHALDDLIAARQEERKAIYDSIKAGKENNSLSEQDEKSKRKQIAAYDQIIQKAQEMQREVKNFDQTNDESDKKVKQLYQDIKNEAKNAGLAVKDLASYFKNIKFDSALQEKGKKDLKTLLGTTPDELSVYKAKIQDITKALDSMGKSNTKIAALSQKYKDLLASIETSGTVSAEAKNSFQNLANETRQTMGGVANDMKTLMAGAADHIVEKFNSAKDRLSAIMQQMKDFIKGLDFQHVVKTITSTTAAVGQLASGIQMINNLPSIWDNEDLTIGQKITQTLMNVSAAIGLLMPNLIKLTAKFNELTFAQLLNAGIESALSMERILSDATLQDEIWHLGAAKLAQKGYTDAQIAEMDYDAILAVGRTVKIGQLIAEKGIKEKLIIVTNQLTVAEWGLNAATFAFIAIIAAIVAALTALQFGLLKIVDIISKKITGKSFDEFYDSIGPVGQAIYNLIAPFALLIKKIKELIAVKKEEKEATEREKKAEEEYLKSSKAVFTEAEEIAKETLTAFKGYDVIWKSFQEGKTAIDDFHDSMVSVLTDLGKIDDPAIVEKLALAKATGDYTELNTIVQEAEQKAKNALTSAQKALNELERMEDAKNFKENNSEQKIPRDITGGYAEEIANRATGGKVDFTYKKKVSDFSNEEIEYLRSSEGQEALSNVDKAIDSQISEISAELNRVDLSKWERDALEQEKELLEQRREYIQSWVTSIKALFFDDDWIAKEDEMAKENKASDAALEYFNFDSNTTDVEIKKAIQGYAKETGKTYKEAMADAMTYEPDSTDQIAKVGAYLTKTTDSINQLIKDQNIQGINLEDEVIAGNVADFGLKMSKQGVDINKIDLSQLDKEDLKAIALGTISEDAINRIATSITDAEQKSALLYADWENLGVSAEDFSSKLSKGMSDTDLAKLMSKDEWTESVESAKLLTSVFKDDKKLKEYLDMLEKPDGHSTKELAKAWEYVEQGAEQAGIAVKSVNFSNVKDDIQKVFDTKHKFWATADLSEVENKLEDLKNSDNEVNVKIKAEIDESTEDFKTKFNDLLDISNDIGENLIVNANDLQELANSFPGILDGMVLLADGTYQLSQQSVNAAIKNTKDELEAEKTAELEKIDLQIAILQAKKDSYDEMIKIADTALADGIVSQSEYNTAISKMDEQLNKVEQANTLDTAIFQDGVIDDTEKHWTEHYDNLIDESNDWATAIIANANAIKNMDESSTVTSADFIDNDNPVFRRETHVTSTEYYVYDEQAAINHLKAMKNFAAAQSASTQNEIDSLETLRTTIEAVGNSYEQQFSNIGKSTDATKANTDATKENAEAQAELLDLLNEEIDVYHDLNIAIKQVNNELSSLQKQEEKLTGDALTKNLEEQNKLLEQQIQNYQELARRKTADLVSTRSYLESQGMNFDENGNMMNHDEVILNKMEEVNNLRSEYNSLSAEEQEGFKERVEAAEEEYEMLKKKIDLYDELQTDTIPQALADIAEAENKIIENNIKTFDLKFQIEFDKADAEKEYREFRNKVIKDLKEDDILGNTLASYEDLSYYRNIQGTGKIQILSQELSELQQARQDLAETGTSVFGDNAAAIEERIKSVTSELYKAQIEEKEAINAIEDQYLDAIDTVGDKIKEQIDAYSKISDLIEHDINLIKLLYGEEAATEAVQKFQQQQEKQLWQQYDMYVKWSAQAQKEMNKVEIGSDAWKKWRSQWEEAQTGIRQSLEDIAQSIIDTYTTTIDTIYQKLDEKLGGALGLESLKSTYDFMQEQADKYLDTVNGAYAIEKLSKEMQDQINATDDIKAQQRLSELKDQEIKNLREKDKLTQYDIDRANALYDIEVKKIALKEAQQNKSKMRLRRDSQGNYSYQFVADENSIATAAQELADAQNTLFNLDKDAYKNNLDDFYKLFTEFKEKQKQIYIDYADDAEKRQEALLQLEKTYGPAINDVIEQNANIRINHEESAFEDIGELYDLNAEDLQNMADTEKDILMNQLVPNWTNGIQDMIGQIVGEGGFLAAIQESNAELEKNVYLFKKDLGNVENAAKEQFGNDIANGNDSIVNTMESLIDSNETIIAQWATLIDELKEIVNYVVTLSKTGIRVIEAGSVAENDNQSIPIQLKNSENTTGQSTYSLDNNGYTQTTYNSIDKNKSINKTLKPKENLSPQAVQFLESVQNDPTWTKANIKQALNTINFVEAHNNQKDTSKQILDSISDKVRQNITALTRMLSFDKNSSIIGSIGNEVKTEPTSVQQNNYISADFPNAKDVYEILLAFETLENQATQMAYTTRR